MFNKTKPLEDQIRVYIGWCVRHDNRCGTYNFWLREFLRYYQGDAFDITNEDIDNFLTDIAVLYQGQHQLDQARRAVEGLRRYYVARGHNLVSRRELSYNQPYMRSKDVRNRELIEKRLDNPKIWSWGVLGKHFNIHKTTAEEIFYTQLHKFFPEKLSTVKSKKHLTS